MMEILAQWMAPPLMAQHAGDGGPRRSAPPAPKPADGFLPDHGPHSPPYSLSPARRI